jgi:hypothetical protein
LLIKNVEIVFLENQNAKVLIPYFQTSAEAERLFYLFGKGLQLFE